MQPPIPANEAARLAALRALGILDTPPDERFERITRVARRILGVPITLIGLIDDERQWFKSCQGLDSSETPRGLTFCAYALNGDGPLLVPDATRDPRFADNPMVVGPPHIRSYAGYPLRSPDGYIYGTLCVIDTTPRTYSADDIANLADLAAWCESELNNEELNRAHAALRESEERLRTVITSAPIVLFSIDRDGIITLSEGRGLEALGAEPGASVGTSIYSHERRTPETIAAFQRALAGESFSQALTSGGRTFETYYAPLHDETGRVTGVIGVGTDVTDRAQAEEDLRETLTALERQFHAADQARSETSAIIDAASEGMALVAPDRRFLLVNRCFAELFGLAAEEIVGHRFEKFAPLVEQVFDDPPAFQRLVGGTASDTAREFTAQVTQCWPRERDLQLYSTPIRDEQAGFLGRLYVLRDITREREVDRMKSEFVARVSHELRSSFTSLKGVIDLLLDDDTGNMKNDFLHHKAQP
ncbi:MAG: PAS domain-containing protein [Thermomicrobiales bacterium]